MNLDKQDRASRTAGSSARRRNFSAAPGLEPLEGRLLLSRFYSGPSAIRPVQGPGGIYTVSVNGPGLVNTVQLGRGVVGLRVSGTTSNSTLNVVLTRPRLHAEVTPLPIGSIKIVSGLIGSINAPDAVLTGTLSPVRGSVGTLAFAGLGRNARVDVLGGLSSLSVGAIDLGPNGHVDIGGDLTGPLSIGALEIDGGRFDVGEDLTGNVSVGSVDVAEGGRFSVGRDVTGTFAVSGDLRLESAGVFSVGRELNSLTVGGDLIVAPSADPAAQASQIVVGGNLGTLTVDGQFRGQDRADASDLQVGLDVGLLSVLGSAPNQGSLYQANIDVTKSILGLDVRHGIFESLVTAGVLIDGASTGLVGPDGIDAVYNSQVLAGANIRNLTFNGDVRSTWVNGPQSGYPTRIVAGVTRAGSYMIGGTIDNLQITGALIDAVLAASVAPSGGAGILPPAGYGPTYDGTPSAAGTYDAPAGTITGGTVGAPVAFANFAVVSYVNETRVNPPGTFGDFNLALTPAVDDTILPGSINPSFASAPLPTESVGTITVSHTSSGTDTSSGSTTTTTIASLADPNSPYPLPTRSTVLGGVISTPHAAGTADFAGIFTSDARGVFVGTLPS